MKIGAIVQARVSSTRLPVKVLRELPFKSGITVLGQVIRRLKKTKMINDIIIATTTRSEDNKIVNVSHKEGAKYFRGSKENVLSRYYLAAKEHSLDVVVRVTSDCPCIDPEIVDLAIKKHLESKADYTSNSLKRTYPHGLDMEVFNFNVLKKAYKNAKKDYEKEHVTPYIYMNPDNFRIAQLRAPKRLYAPDIRITLDTEEDYALLCVIFDFLYPKNKFFDVKDIIKLFMKKPWLKIINQKIAQKKICGNLKDEILEAMRVLDLQGLKKARHCLERHIVK